MEGEAPWNHSIHQSTRHRALPGRSKAVVGVRVAASGREDVQAFPAELMRRIQKSSKIGHAMQMTREAPTFVGYTVDIDPKSKAKVSTYVKNCVE
jgi:hypothetical protein